MADWRQNDRQKPAQDNQIQFGDGERTSTVTLTVNSVVHTSQHTTFHSQMIDKHHITDHIDHSVIMLITLHHNA